MVLNSLPPSLKNKPLYELTLMSWYWYEGKYKALPVPPFTSAASSSRKLPSHWLSHLIRLLYRLNSNINMAKHLLPQFLNCVAYLLELKHLSSRNVCSFFTLILQNVCQPLLLTPDPTQQGVGGHISPLTHMTTPRSLGSIFNSPPFSEHPSAFQDNSRNLEL